MQFEMSEGIKWYVSFESKAALFLIENMFSRDSVVLMVRSSRIRML